MGVGHLLPDFGSTVEGLVPGRPSEVDVESLKLDAFESGYKAGWDDSVKAQGEEAGRVSAELARTLQDLSFTYHEARSQILASLRPLFGQIVELVLPALVRDTLSARVTEELQALADGAAGARVDIRAAPGDLPALDRLERGDFGFPLEISADPSLEAGQVLLRVGAQERQIDMGEVLTGIRSAVEGFFDDNLREQAHG